MNVMLYSCPQCFAEFELADAAASACPECGHGAANDVGALRRPEAAGSTARTARRIQHLDRAAEVQKWLYVATGSPKCHGAMREMKAEADALRTGRASAR